MVSVRKEPASSCRRMCDHKIRQIGPADFYRAINQFPLLGRRPQLHTPVSPARLHVHNTTSPACVRLAYGHFTAKRILGMSRCGWRCRSGTRRRGPTVRGNLGNDLAVYRHRLRRHRLRVKETYLTVRRHFHPRNRCAVPAQRSALLAEGEQGDPGDMRRCRILCIGCWARVCTKANRYSWHGVGWERLVNGFPYLCPEWADWKLAVTALLAFGAIVSTLGGSPRPGDAPATPVQPTDAPEPGQPA